MKNNNLITRIGISATMPAPIEIKDLEGPAHQTEIADVVEALDGVIELKSEKGLSASGRPQREVLSIKALSLAGRQFTTRDRMKVA
jgi:hypothetical protein